LFGEKVVIKKAINEIWLSPPMGPKENRFATLAKEFL